MGTETSPTRSRAAWKPRIADAPLPFLELSAHAIALGIDDGEDVVVSDDMRSPIVTPPYRFADGTGDVGRAGVIDAADCVDAIGFSVRMIGGLDSNALEVSWQIADPALSMRWIVLKTFSGMQLRYLKRNERQTVRFALAGDDAYAYCDKDPCEDCTFHCKRGFVLYGCVEGIGIVEVPVHEPTANSQTDAVASGTGSLPS